MSRKELIFQADNQRLDPSADRIQDLDSLLGKYNDSLLIVASEEKQWLSVTGLPKNGNPVETTLVASLIIQISKLLFKLLSCISQARASGVTQSEAARITKQDARSFPARTKQLVEHGLMSVAPCRGHVLICRTKTPILINGNVTYRLTHSRYTPSSSDALSILPVSAPVAVASLNPVQPSSTQAGAIATIATNTSNSPPPSTNLGFSRDRTIGNQIRQVIGDGEWNRQVLLKFPSR